MANASNNKAPAAPGAAPAPATTQYVLTRKGTAYRPTANATQWGILAPVLAAGPTTLPALVAALVAAGMPTNWAATHVRWHVAQGRLAPAA